MKPQLILVCLAASLHADDRVPREMKPKHVRDGAVLVDEKFDASTLDPKWIIPQVETGSTVKIEEGRATIEAGIGAGGALGRKFETMPARPRWTRSG